MPEVIPFRGVYFLDPVSPLDRIEGDCAQTKPGSRRHEDFYLRLSLLGVLIYAEIDRAQLHVLAKHWVVVSAVRHQQQPRLSVIPCDFSILGGPIGSDQQLQFLRGTIPIKVALVVA